MSNVTKRDKLIAGLFLHLGFALRQGLDGSEYHPGVGLVFSVVGTCCFVYLLISTFCNIFAEGRGQGEEVAR